MSISNPKTARNEKRAAIRDPDYESTPKKTRILPEEKQKQVKVMDIINREYCLEMKLKENQAEKIEERIKKTKFLLHQLRYSIVVDYYKNPRREEPIFQDTKTKQIENYSSLHPIVKKLRPLDKSNTCSKGVEFNNIGSIQEATSSKQNNVLRCSESVEEVQNVVLEPPSETVRELSSLNSARCSNQTKHYIVVGNTSKYIGIENPSDSTTHNKWMWLIYVQCKSETPIENMVSKVRFFLHTSYGPNDVVDIQ